MQQKTAAYRMSGLTRNIFVLAMKEILGGNLLNATNWSLQAAVSRTLCPCHNCFCEYGETV